MAPYLSLFWLLGPVCIHSLCCPGFIAADAGQTMKHIGVSVSLQKQGHRGHGQKGQAGGSLSLFAALRAEPGERPKFVICMVT